MTIADTLRNAGGYQRKPMMWHEVGDPIPHEMLASLEKFTSEELGIDEDLDAELCPPVSALPTEFLVTHNGGLYLVNTEGYGYARYVRYVGHTDPTPKHDIVKIKWGSDETPQLVEVTELLGQGFIWSFVTWDDPGFKIGGPFPTRQEAIDDATAYCQRPDCF